MVVLEYFYISYQIFYTVLILTKKALGIYYILHKPRNKYKSVLGDVLRDY